MGTWIEIYQLDDNTYTFKVVPYVGTWIEIALRKQDILIECVVPYVGTWIEISYVRRNRTKKVIVVPYVGTWIEMSQDQPFLAGNNSRSLRGNVDRNCTPGMES